MSTLSAITLAITSFLLIGCGILIQEGLESAGAISCVESQDQIDWQDKPVIDEEGVLTLSGKTKRGQTIGSDEHHPFNFSNYKEKQEGYILETVGPIDGHTLSEDGTEFSVRYQVPSVWLDRDNYKLVVAVWGKDPRPGNALGGWCVKYQ